MVTEARAIPRPRVEVSWWRKNKRKVLRALWLGFLQIFLTALVITFLVPTIWMVVSSFKASTEIFAHPIVWIPKKWLWRNYVEAATILPLGRFALNTLIVTSVATLGTVVSSAIVAYSFSRLRWPGRDFFFGLLLATIMLPEVVTLVPRFIMFRWFKWVDTFLPLTVPYWFGTATFYVFLMRQFLRGIPMELEDAARIDGCSRFRILWQILMPLSKPVLATVTVFSLIQHYNDYMNPLIYLNKMELWTLALAIRTYNSQYVANWEWIFAVGTMMLIPMLILFIVAQRYFVQGITLTGFGGQ
ncbi:MAG: carbohydrate ABC transporter permease [Anaerolineae bacterium]